MINKDLFVPLEREIAGAKKEETLGYWQDAWIRLKKNKMALLGLIIIVCLIVVAILALFFLAILMMNRI